MKDKETADDFTSLVEEEKNKIPDIKGLMTAADYISSLEKRQHGKHKTGHPQLLPDTYIETLKKDGEEAGFILVFNFYHKRIERCAHHRLKHAYSKKFGWCISPDQHKEDVTVEVFIEFWKFNGKFYASGCQNELRTIPGLLICYLKSKVSDHLNRRPFRCSDLPAHSIASLDDPDASWSSADYDRLSQKTGAGEMNNALIFDQSLKSLSIVEQNVVKDRLERFSFREIGERRGLSEVNARKIHSKAFFKFRRFGKSDK